MKLKPIMTRMLEILVLDIGCYDIDVTFQKRGDSILGTVTNGSNHGGTEILKQVVAKEQNPDDWVIALVD